MRKMQRLERTKRKLPLLRTEGPFRSPRSRVERNLKIALAIILLLVAIGVPVLLGWYGELRYEQAITDVNLDKYHYYEREGRE